MNVISLFNGFIPLVAIQMQALRIGDQVSLIFTKVLDQLELGLVEENEEVYEVADRTYWEKLATRQALEMTDALLSMVRTLDPDLALKYNKFYVGVAKKNGRAKGFVIFRPKKDWVRIEPRLAKSDAIQAKLEEAGVDVMEYDERWGRYRIRLEKGDIQRHDVLLRDLLKIAYSESGR